MKVKFLKTEIVIVIFMVKVIVLVVARMQYSNFNASF